MKHPEPIEKTRIRTTLSVVQFPLDRKSKELQYIHIRTDHVQVLTDYNRGHKSRAAITLQGGGGDRKLQEIRNFSRLSQVSFVDKPTQ